MKSRVRYIYRILSGVKSEIYSVYIKLNPAELFLTPVELEPNIEYIRLFTPDKLYIYTKYYVLPSMNFLYILSIYTGSYP